MDIASKDKQFVWHPYTQMQNALPHIPVVKGRGAYLFSDDGRKFIDAISSWWVNVHGHSHPLITQAIARQAATLEHVMFAGFTHEKAVELAERLLMRLPSNQKKIFYSDDGSTAVEAGLKMALQFWHNRGEARTRIIAMEGAYHGDTFGAMSVSGASAFNAPFEKLLFEADYIPFPHEEDAKTLEGLMSAIRPDTAALIIEPLVQGAAGMRIYSADLLGKIFALCRENRILIIADEVMTGFGRTGKLFAVDHIKEKPDIICMSKGITGGAMPLGATSCTEDIYNAFLSDDRRKTFFHGHSFTANPLACAAACASMDLFEEQQTWRNIENITQKHLAFAEELSGNPLVTNVRHMGTVLAFDIKTEDQTNYFNRIRDDAYLYFLSKGILLRPLGNVVYVLPPYCIGNELESIYNGIMDFLDDYSSSSSGASS